MSIVLSREMSGGKSKYNGFFVGMTGCTLPRQSEKAKSCVLDLGLDVLDLEGNGPWSMITAKSNLKKFKN